ncbi:MAG TPA: cytochrome c3 family protein [Polyangia bacterium]|nr:cytochrome c3 family protein [Polyangia bacterium]
MATLFPRWSDTAFRLALVGLVLLGVGGVVGLFLYVRTPDNLNRYFPVDQPVPFDHRHHVQDDGIDCRYCHDTVTHSAFAGIPSTAVCMGCHNQVWPRSPVLEPVRRSYFTGLPLPWNRVHDLPDFVYFNHAIHVNKGVGCVTCHGRVDEMALVYQVAPLTMGWCLDCHRAPEAHLRPRTEITSMTWQPSGDAKALGRQLAEEYGVRHLTHCTACHR